MKKTHILIILIIALFLEVMVFNITSYRILFGNFEKKTYTEFEFLEYENRNAKIQISDINTKVGTFKIKLQDIENAVEYRVFYADETTNEYRELNSKQYIESNEKSKSIPLFLSGNTSKIMLVIDKDIYDGNNIVEITLNEKIPFEFNVFRFIITISIILFIYLMKHNDLFNQVYSEKNFKQEVVLLVILTIFFLLVSFINTYSSGESSTLRANDTFFKVDEAYSSFYNKDFVDSIIAGKLYLLEDPSEKFMELEQPYDPLERKVLEREVDYRWDTAYYNGHQYVYFGILPVLLTFLPYHLLTGNYLKISAVVFGFSLLIFILLKEILLKLINRYFKEIPFKNVIYLFITFCSGTLIFYANGISRFYEVVIIAGLYFVLQGIFFILKSLEKEKNRYKNIFLGCFCLALSVACRPTDLLISIIILPYLISLLVKNIKKIKKDKKDLLKLLLAVGIPYITIGILLMIYNYVRFESVFEFGAKYQLTINNMMKLKSRIFTIPVGIICNLFSIPNFIAEFPFIANHNELITFNGFYYIENMLGGLFIIAPICFFNFFIFKINKKLENKELKCLINTLLVVGSLIAIISIMMAGSNQRYIIDYAWIFILSGILIFMVIYNWLKSDEAKKILQYILCITTIFTFILSIQIGIVSEKSYMKAYSPKEYYKMRYTICFWE